VTIVVGKISLAQGLAKGNAGPDRELIIRKKKAQYKLKFYLNI
jgi:hypothetical protein